MIALPGLTLVNGRWDIAKDILADFAKHVDRGMLPNRFPDSGEAPEYNTVDATLWFLEAVRSFTEYFSRANRVCNRRTRRVSVKFPKSSMEMLRMHRAVAFAQAWSVAELLRAIVEIFNSLRLRQQEPLKEISCPEL